MDCQKQKKQQLQRKTLHFIAGDDTNHVLQSKQNDRQKKKHSFPSKLDHSEQIMNMK